MLRSLPKFDYNGLTVILSYPSRFDTKELLSGVAGYKFNEECLRPETNRFCCDIRQSIDNTPLLPNTKLIITCGRVAFENWVESGRSKAHQDYYGTPVKCKVDPSITIIPTYSPQETLDVMDYESKYNPLYTPATTEDEDGDYKTNHDEESGDVKRRTNTRRFNWYFWMKQHVKKSLRILKNPELLSSHHTPEYKIYPTSDEVITILSSAVDRVLYLDLETDPETGDIRCVGFNVDNTNTYYVVPFLDLSYQPSYGNLPQIVRALALAMSRNIVVAHNGDQFDFPVMALKLRIAATREYDTLVANQRIYPDVEKSLGHCMALWTYLPYHKDEGTHTYRTQQQANQLFEYCGKDVYGMRIIREEQLKFAKTIPGLTESIEQVMASLPPYMLMSMMGVKYDNSIRQAWIKVNDRLMTQYLRVMRGLTGPAIEPLISNQKCVRYFHDMLKYRVVGRSTKTRRPSLARKLLLKLKLIYRDNPVIDFLIRYREVQKETGTLNFTPWMPDEKLPPQDNQVS